MIGLRGGCMGAADIKGLCSACYLYGTEECSHKSTVSNLDTVQPLACFIPKQCSPVIPINKQQDSKWYFLKPNGRFSRSQFVFFYFIPNLITAILQITIYFGISRISSDDGGLFWLAVVLGWFFWPCLVFTIYITIIAGIRRFHDLNKSGWYMLLILIPVVGFFVLLYLIFTAGEVEGNRWL